MENWLKSITGTQILPMPNSEQDYNITPDSTEYERKIINLITEINGNANGSKQDILKQLQTNHCILNNGKEIWCEIITKLFEIFWKIIQIYIQIKMRIIIIMNHQYHNLNGLLNLIGMILNLIKELVIHYEI